MGILTEACSDNRVLQPPDSRTEEVPLVSACFPRSVWTRRSRHRSESRHRAATAKTLARRGAAVLVTYLTIQDDYDPRIPDTYHLNRSGDATTVVSYITDAGEKAFAVEADLSDEAVIPNLFDTTQRELGGPVDILVNNATGWVPFTAKTTDDLGRSLQRVTAATVDQQFSIDARATALLISEYADRHAAFDLTWGRIIGLTSGGPLGFPSEVSYGAAKAALESYSMAAALELADRGITSNVVYPPGTNLVVAFT